MSNVTSICGIPLGAAGPHQVESAQGYVVLSKLSLTLQYVYLYGRLVICCRGEISDLREGMVVFLSIIVVVTPPRVSIPKVRV